jgi:hypothetical protein
MLFSRLSPRDLPLSKYEKFVSKDRVSPDEGVIEYLMNRIRPECKFCIEFGARDGLRAHTSFLIRQYGFAALYLEGDQEAAGRLVRNFSDNPDVRTEHAFITRGNIEEIFRRNAVPENPFILLIDMDGNDYYIWESITHYNPQVVSIEYNPGYRPPERFVIDYQKDFMWSGDDYYGASMQSLVDLGRKKGYELVHCSSGGDNLFFVKDEYYALFGIQDNSADRFYQLPQYGRNGRAANGKGHPISKRNSTLMQRIGARLRYRMYSIPRKLVKKQMKYLVDSRSTHD